MRTTEVIPSPHFDPATYPYESFGLVEELIDVVTHKCLGMRRVPTADRPLGSQGAKEFDLTEDVEIMRGHHFTILKASPKKPRRVRGMLQVVCGKYRGDDPKAA